MAKQSGKRNKSTANSAKRLDKRSLNPGYPSTLKPFVKGDPRINLSGRPKLIGEASKKILASVFPPEMISTDFKKIVAAYTGDPQAMITYAERIVLSQAMKAASGDTNAAREMRSATEANHIDLTVNWRDTLRSAGIDPDAVYNEAYRKIIEAYNVSQVIENVDNVKTVVSDKEDHDTSGN